MDNALSNRNPSSRPCLRTYLAPIAIHSKHLTSYRYSCCEVATQTGLAYSSRRYPQLIGKKAIRSCLYPLRYQSHPHHPFDPVNKELSLFRSNTRSLPTHPLLFSSWHQPPEPLLRSFTTMTPTSKSSSARWRARSFMTTPQLPPETTPSNDTSKNTIPISSKPYVSLRTGTSKAFPPVGPRRSW